MDKNITQSKKFDHKLKFFKGESTFKEFTNSINSNLVNILCYLYKRSVNIKNIPKKIRIGDFKFKQFNGDKSRDESRIYFHKKKIVLKIRIVKKGGLAFGHCVNLMNIIEKQYYGININLYNIISIRDIIKNVEFDEKIKIINFLKKNEIYFIYTYYRGVSLNLFKRGVFDSAEFNLLEKTRLAKIILLKFVMLLIVLDDLELYLSDMQIRNFGICSEYHLSVLDEEMIHVESNKKLRRDKLIDLFWTIDHNMFQSVCVKIDLFKKELMKKMKSYFEGMTEREIFRYYVEQELKVSIENKKKRKREKGPLKKRKKRKKK